MKGFLPLTFGLFPGKVDVVGSTLLTVVAAFAVCVVFVAMLALKITRRFEAALHRTFGSTVDDPAAITPDDALVALGRLTYLYSTDRNGQRHTHLPRPDDQQAKILDAIGLSFPLKAKAEKRAV